MFFSETYSIEDMIRYIPSDSDYTSRFNTADLITFGIGGSSGTGKITVEYDTTNKLYNITHSGRNGRYGVPLTSINDGFTVDYDVYIPYTDAKGRNGIAVYTSTTNEYYILIASTSYTGYHGSETSFSTPNAPNKWVHVHYEVNNGSMVLTATDSNDNVVASRTYTNPYSSGEFNIALTFAWNITSTIQLKNLKIKAL